MDAFNRADAEALAAFYEDNAINHQVAEEPVEGREAIREMFANGFARTEMVCIIENVFEDGEWAILEWRDPKGLRGCGFFHVVSSKMSEGIIELRVSSREGPLPIKQPLPRP